MHDTVTQVSGAAVAVWLLQQAKRAGWLSRVSTTVQRLAASLLAVAAAAGISFRYDAEAGTLLVCGLTAAGVAHFVGDCFQQFVLQELVYRGAVKETNGE